MNQEFETTFFKSKILKRDNFFAPDIEINKEKLVKVISNQSVLVIGGAGTIGSSYIKNLLAFKPSKLIVVDINENGLTELTRDLRSTDLLNKAIDYRTYPISLNDKVFDKLFLAEGGFDIVANFSAHKHVRSEKDIFSIEALLRNNVFGAIKLLDLLKQVPPKYFFSVSTDKAANPVNIMGASKSLMEKIILSYKDQFNVATARFANVAFSNGSLLEGFVNRIDKNQPISCPTDIKRFFVTPQESGQICMLATFIGSSGDIFFPKFDFHKDQIFFKDIAIAFLDFLGLTPDVCVSDDEAKAKVITSGDKKYPIYLFSSDTSGEKGYEEFYTEKESYLLDEYVTLGVVKSDSIVINNETLQKEFNELFERKDLSKKDLVHLISKYVPDFQHIETGKNLDQKM